MKLEKKSKDGAHSLKISISSKVFEAPNQKVRKFAEEHFGSYRNYLEEIRRFLKEDALKILDALGEGPLLYCQTKGESFLLDSIQQIHHQFFYKIFSETRKNKGRPVGSICEIDQILGKQSAKINIPQYVIQYVPAADLYLSEDKFSMDINTYPVPLLPVGGDGKISIIGATCHNYQDAELTKDSEKNQSLMPIVKSIEKTIELDDEFIASSIGFSSCEWGKLAKDPKLYQSLTSIVKSVKGGIDMPVVKFEWSDGCCEFLKKQQKIGNHIQKYMEEKLLGAPK